MTYTVKLIPDTDDGGYVVEIPALLGCVTQGDTEEEALAMAKDAAELWLSVLVEDGKPIPSDVPVTVDDDSGMLVRVVTIGGAVLA